MTAKKMPKKKKSSQNLKDWNTILLWVAAGGQCEMCRKRLTESDTTFDSLNLAERAHIVGQGGPTSPRHDPVQSVSLATSPENIMLLCFNCHSEIDDPKTRNNFPVEMLREIKRAHEERIHYLTSLGDKKTRVVVFQTAIQQSRAGLNSAQQTPTIHRDDLREAILPDYFSDQKEPVRIRIDLPTNESASHWQQLQETLVRRWDRLDLDEVKHLSIFSLGKIPAMVFFGQQVGSVRKIRVMNVQGGGPTRWLSSDQVASNFKYEITRPDVVEKTQGDVLLLISFSGIIEEKQYAGAVQADLPRYQIATADGHRHPNFLIAEKQLEDFKKIYVELLSEIQEKHGQDTKIHLFIAAPTPVVFEIGRQYRMNNHPALLLYNCVAMKYKFAFSLGGHDDA